MKKTVLILSILAFFMACKDKKEGVNETNTTNENPTAITTGSQTSDTVIVENGDTIQWEDPHKGPNISSDGGSGALASDKAIFQRDNGKYGFRFNLKVGETYPFLLKTKTTQTLSSEGQTITMASSRTVDFDYLVEDISNNYRLKATFKNFSESATGPDGKTISYSTSGAKPTDKEVAQNWAVYNAIKGQSFQMLINDQGKVLGIIGLDKVRANVLAKLKSEFTVEEQGQLKELLEYSLSNEAISSQFEESMNIFPDKDIKIGENWEDSQNINEGPLKGNSRVTRVLKSVDTQKATITVNGVQNVSGSDTRNGITASMKNNATINGHLDLDVHSGWIKKVSITKKETIDNSYSQEGQSYAETGTQTVETTVN
ncbi:MAG: DUF6263 family protein [Weeksellaceae bacterium]